MNKSPHFPCPSAVSPRIVAVMLAWLTLVAWSLLPMPDDAQAEMGSEHPSLPLAVILATGGTIAGEGDRRNKPHTTRVAALQSPDFGALGHVLDGQVDIRLVTTSADPGHIGFSLAGLTKSSKWTFRMRTATTAGIWWMPQFENH